MIYICMLPHSSCTIFRKIYHTALTGQKKDEGKLGGVLKLYCNDQPWCPSFSHHWQTFPPVLHHLHQLGLLASDSSLCLPVSQGRWIRTGVSQDQSLPLQLPLIFFLCPCGTWKLLQPVLESRIPLLTRPSREEAQRSQMPNIWL